MHAWAMAWLDLGVGIVAAGLLGPQTQRTRLALTAVASLAAGTSRWLLHPADESATGAIGLLMVALPAGVLAASAAGLLLLWWQQRALTSGWAATTRSSGS